MVTASDQAGTCCSAVMTGEVGVLVRRPLCGLSYGSNHCHKVCLTNVFNVATHEATHEANSYLDNYEAGTTVVSTLEVDGALIVRDVEALDSSSFLERRCICEGKGKKRGEEG